MRFIKLETGQLKDGESNYSHCSLEARLLLSAYMVTWTSFPPSSSLPCIAILSPLSPKTLLCAELVNQFEH